MAASDDIAVQPSSNKEEEDDRKQRFLDMLYTVEVEEAAKVVKELEPSTASEKPAKHSIVAIGAMFKEQRASLRKVRTRA